MSSETNIAWTDSTFNPWWGCTKIAPGCDHCYAEALDKRTGGSHWGKEGQPRIMSDNNWKSPIKWNKQAQATHTRHKVFCGSMCDVFDNKAPQGQRERLWEVIRSTPNLDWQLLTKRPQNIQKYLPEDWGDGYPNVWLGVTVENRQHGFKRIEILREIPATLRFLSIEPLLEFLGSINMSGIDWVIIGGESGPNARYMKTFWALDIIAQCTYKNVPVFFKQWGSRNHDKGGCLINGEELKKFPCQNKFDTQPNQS